MLDILEAYKEGKDSSSLVSRKDYKAKEPINEREHLYPYLTNDKQIKNGTNEHLYQAEKAFLKGAELRLQDEEWVSNPRLRRYTFGQLIQQIFGRPYDPKLDSNRLQTAHMFSHYSSKVTKNGCYELPDGTWKKKNQRRYSISVKRIREAKPFSIRLRVEQMMAEGKMPTWRDCKLYKPLVAPGARALKTNEHLLDGQERGREIYEEKSKERSEAAKKDKQ